MLEYVYPKHRNDEHRSTTGGPVTYTTGESDRHITYTPCSTTGGYVPSNYPWFASSR